MSTSIKNSEEFSGVISAFDAADGLGDVALQDGRVVRFSLRACGPMRPDPGLPVVVNELTNGFGGTLRAGRVRPATARPVETRLVWPEPWTEFEEGAHWEPGDRKFLRFEPDAFFAQHGDWVDGSELRDLILDGEPGAFPTELQAPPPIFAPWADQITRSFCAASRLDFTRDDGQSLVFATGASLEGSWPSCSTCGEGMDLVLYLRDLFVRVIGDVGYFAAFLCSACCDELALDGGPWHFEWGTPRTEARRPARNRPPKITMPEKRVVTAQAMASYPDSRTLASCTGAASKVLAVVVRAESKVDAMFPRSREQRHPASDLYREWLGIDGKGSCVGGFPHWRHDLDGEHPSCASCARPMGLLCALAEEDSGMPLGDDVGGTLYFFVCDRSPCARRRIVRVVHQFE